MAAQQRTTPNVPSLDSDADHAPTGAFSPGGYGGSGDEGEARSDGQTTYDDGITRVHMITQTPLLGSFSPQTCIELLPTLSDKQLERETDYYRALMGPSFCPKQTTKKSPASLSRAMIAQLQSDINQIVTNYKSYDVINQHFCMLLDRAESLVTAVSTPVLHADTPTQVTPDTCTILKAPPVSFVCASISSTVEECSQGAQFRTLGGREVDYFGTHPYPYGKTKHLPKPYPNTRVFKSIVDSITQYDPDFNLTDYSCLMTRYKDGSSSIPPHSDIEYCIARDSSIYTVSVGAERTLLCQNLDGRLSEQSYTLTDGSIHVMSRASQDLWEHSIAPEPSCKLPRISFTFRKMVPGAVPPPRPPVPPIKEDAVASDMGRIPNKRVLFLSDSINSGFNPHRFLGTGVTCIRKPLYELADIAKYERELEFTDYVVISAGINDISRYGQGAQSISCYITGKLGDWARRFPNTCFIFNSILSTNYLWLNKRAAVVNKAVFNLSLKLYTCNNFYFLDSHARLLDANISQVISPLGNGVHITQQASSIVQLCIVDCVVALDRALLTGRAALQRVWPLRRQFRQSAADFHSWRNPRNDYHAPVQRDMTGHGGWS